MDNPAGHLNGVLVSIPGQRLPCAKTRRASKQQIAGGAIVAGSVNSVRHNPVGDAKNGLGLFVRRKKRVGEYGNRVEAVKLDGLFHVYGACGRIGDGMNDNENGAKPFGRRRPLTVLNSSWMSCGFSNRAARCKPLKYNQLQANTILSTKRKGLFAFLYENNRLHEGRERDEVSKKVTSRSICSRYN